MRRNIAFKGAGLAALALGLTTAWPALADMRVIESSAKQYAVGTVLPNDAVIKLEAGERVQVLVVPGNLTRVFEGKGSHSLEPRGGTRSATKKKAE